MTVTVISSTIDTSPTGGLIVGNDDALILQQSGVIYYDAVTNHTTVTLGTGASLVVSGVIYGAYTALDCLGSDNVTIQSTGYVEGNTGITMAGGANLTNNGTVMGHVDAVDLLGQATLTNNGTISADIDTGVQLAGDDTILINTGHVSGLAKGVQLNGDIARAQVTNSGDISADTGSALRDLGRSSTIVNSGRITGEVEGVFITSISAGGAHALVNSGQISATGVGVNIDVFTGMTATVENSGTIEGSVGLQVISSLNSTGGTVSVHNAAGGTIIGRSGQVVLSTDRANTVAVVNEGTITASGLGGATVHAAATLTLTNSGLIVATDAAGTAILMDGGAQARIVNSGTIQGAITLGTAGDSLQTSGTINGTVNLGGGNDTLNALGGHVTGTVLGGAGNDLFILDDAGIAISEAAAGGSDTVQSAVSYTLATGQEIEVLTLTGSALSGTGNDLANTVNGNDLANGLSGLAGIDTLSGGLGQDTLNGGADNDSLLGGDDDDRLYGDIGNDLLSGDNGDDSLWGQAGNDTLNGLAGDDVLKGQAGTDSLSGGDGDDLLTGGKGRDSLTGGLDEDVFIYTKTADTGTVASATNDIITDFVRGTDKIDLSLIDANANTTQNEAFTFLGTAAFSASAGQLRYFLSGANIVLEGDVTGDGVADFQIQVNALTAISAGDLVL